MNDNIRKLIQYYDQQQKYIVPLKPVIKRKPKKKGSSSPSFSEAPLPEINLKPGFDIDGFQSILRQELILEYKKYQSFSHPFISFGECVSCIRQQYYKRKNYPFDLYSFFNFSYLFLIKEVDNFLLATLYEMYEFEEKNKSIQDTTYSVKGVVHAVDQKTGFLYFLALIDPSFDEKYKQYHLDIANIQTYILNHTYKYTIQKIVLIYVPRDLKKIFKFVFDPNIESAQEFLNRGKLLKNALDNNIVPDVLGKEDISCNNCMFKKYCDIENKKENKNNNLVVLL